MPNDRPLTDKELRALCVDAIDVTMAQARATFAHYRQVEDEMPLDNYAATVTNLLDAIFYMRFGGQWRATAAPHVFQPNPMSTPSRKSKTIVLPTEDAPTRNSIVRNISRALFSG